MLGLESSQQQDSKQGLVGTWTAFNTLGFLYIITDVDDRISDFFAAYAGSSTVPALLAQKARMLG